MVTNRPPALNVPRYRPYHQVFHVASTDATLVTQVRRTPPARAVSVLFLVLASGCSGGVPRLAPSPELESVEAMPRDLTEDQQVLHVLSRLAFGPRPGDVAAVRALGVDRWIEQQLQPSSIPDAASDSLDARFALLAGTPADLMERSPPPFVAQQAATRNGEVPTAQDSLRFREQQRTQGQMVAQLQASRVARAVTAERQLQEVMTEFWLNHFNVFIQKGPTMRHYLPQYERDVIRPLVLGSFRDLLGAVAHSPAMLIYLDNAQSVADSLHTSLLELRARALPNGRPMVRHRGGLNENYGRELLELHTLGVDGGYTQRDVINVARAFTGWSVDQPRTGGDFIFRPGTHDADPKEVLGHSLQGGRGVEDGEQVLDIVAEHPSTARFIARKLAVRLVSDSPGDALVERAATTFRRTHGDIREVVRTIVLSPEFFARSAWRAKVKTPFEVVVSAARALGAEADSTPRTAAAIALLGQPLWGHQAPNGWPDAGRDWMNTGAILNRINFGFAVGAGRLPGAAPLSTPLGREIATLPREAQVERVITDLFGGDVSPDTRSILTTGAHPLAGAASQQAAAPERPDASADASGMLGPPTPGVPGGANGPLGRAGAQLFRRLPPLSGLSQLVALAIGSPEFQRR